MPSLPTQFRCCDCNRDFKTDNGLSAHLQNSAVHRRKKATQNKDRQLLQTLPMKCSMCKKTFQSKSSLKQHQESPKHKPLCHIKCLASWKCNKHFNCPSAQLHHLESGRCPSNMTKAQLNTAIIKNDVDGIITTCASTDWLLEDDISEISTSSVSSPALTPTSTEYLDSYPSTAIHTPLGSFHSTGLVAADLNHMLDSHPGRKRCPICPRSRTRTFERGALRQHLSSSVHAKVYPTLVEKIADEILFHCPMALIKGSSVKKPLKHFSTVSGLTQHIESGACDGGKETFRRAIEYLQNEIKAMDLGGLKLLN